MSILKIVKANSDHTPCPDFQIVSDGEPPVIRGLDDWEKSYRQFYSEQGGSLGAFLVKHLPGGTIDQLLVYLLNHRASLYRVPHLDRIAEEVSNEHG